MHKLYIRYEEFHNSYDLSRYPVKFWGATASPQNFNKVVKVESIEESHIEEGLF